MVPIVTPPLLWTWWSEYSDAALGLVVAAALAILLVVVFLRQRRNSALEESLAHGQFGSPIAFRGSLAVEDYKPGSTLRLSKSTRESRNLQLRYRWLGVGRQAILDEVVFDRAAGLVRLRKRDKERAASFLEFSAVRMREGLVGRGGISVWHVELLPREGAAIPFVTSASGYRKAAFEHTAPVAQAVAEIMQVPIHAVVAGNVWTPGWPPKSR